MHDEARRRQEDARYRCFFLKIADRLKNQGLDDPPALTISHWLEFRGTYPWVHYRAAFLPDLREARVAVVIRNLDAARNCRLFDFILEDKRNIESELGELIWERERNGESHISVRLPNCTIDDSPKALKEVEEWFVQTLRDFARVFRRQLPTKPASLLSGTGRTRVGPTNRTVQSRRTSVCGNGGNLTKTGPGWEYGFSPSIGGVMKAQTQNRKPTP